MIIREMVESDIEEVAALEKRVFKSPWKIDDFRYELFDNPFARYYVIVIDNIIGYIGFWITFETAQITNIAVDLPYQSEGYGSILLDKCIEIAEKEMCENITLEVRVSNYKAISFYKKFGFIEANVRKSYYEDNHEDAYLMIKPLGGAYSE